MAELTALATRRSMFSEAHVIKILFLASTPSDAPPLELVREAEVIRQKLAGADGGEGFDLRVETHTGRANLKQHLFHHKPDVVHFSGHGEPSGKLVLEDAGGRGEPTSVAALNELFGQLQGVRCVVLNACYSLEQAHGIAAGVPCVVGVSRAIEDESAIAFAGGFYQALGFGLSVQEAVESGRNEVTFLRDHPDAQLIQLLPGKRINPKLFRLTPPHLPPPPPRACADGVLHGRYLIREPLDDGRISKVQRAFDAQLGRDVAVKTLLELAAKDAFAKEVRDIAKIDKHPNIVSIYEAWLNEPEPYYVRQFIDGRSLRDELASEGRAVPIDFVHEVLAALGGAMHFAQEMGVRNLGIKPDKVLIQRVTGEVNLGLSSHYYIMISPEIAASEYIGKDLSRASPEYGHYLPPEHFRRAGLQAPDYDKANQYRLGIIGYEMLVGSRRFHDAAAKWLSALSRGAPADALLWPRIDGDVCPDCPSFLGLAIARMIDPRPEHRYPSLKEAIAAISQRDLYVEVARDSFRRIVGDARTEEKFFRAFYARFLGEPAIAAIFKRKAFHGGKALDDPAGRWPDQFRMLKEAIVFLFAYSLLKESQEPTILTRTAQSHRGYKREYYDRFRDVLVETVVEFDKGNYEEELRTAWRKALEPGVMYLADYRGPYPAERGTEGGPFKPPSGTKLRRRKGSPPEDVS